MKHAYQIGAFVLDLRSGELRRDGIRVPMQDLPLRLLGILAAHPGEVVSRDDLQRRLWPDTSFADFEDGLNTAISKLRIALGDDPREPKCIETIRGRGYRLLLPTARIDDVPTLVGSVTPTEAIGADPLPAPARAAPRAHSGVSMHAGLSTIVIPRYFAGIAAIAASVAAAAAWWMSPLPPISNPRITPITTSGRIDFCMRVATDGQSLTYLERDGDHWNLIEDAMNGGAPRRVNAPFRSTAVFDMSRDGREWLVGEFHNRGDAMPLYRMPAHGGTPVRIGDLIAQNAAWSHSGNEIVLTRFGDLWITMADGSRARRLLSLQTQIDWPAWSPSDKSIRLMIEDRAASSVALWEINIDGSGLHEVLPHWSALPLDRYGTWSPDGSFYVFNSEHSGHNDVWALRERGSWWRRNTPGPFQLTDGPFAVTGTSIAPDNSRVYFCADRTTRDLNELDPVTLEVHPFLPELNPAMPAFSKDGSWMSYLAGTPGDLWRSRADGSDRRRLTVQPLATGFPRWSPDGQTLAFTAESPGKPALTYLMPRDGGRIDLLASKWPEARDPDWSPDGTAIVVTHAIEGNTAKTDYLLSTIDVQSRATTVIPGSEQMFGPRWSPRGGYIAATDMDQHAVKLYDLTKKLWHVAAKGGAIGIPVWSRDGAFLYYQDATAPGQPLFRVRPEGGSPELVADFTIELKSRATRWSLLGVAPNGRVLMSVTHSASDIYAVDLSTKR